MRVIELGNKVLSEPQLADLFYALQELSGRGESSCPDDIRFEANPVVGRTDQDHVVLTNARLSVADEWEKEVRTILQRFGFLEYTNGSVGEEKLTAHPSIRSALKHYVEQSIEESREQINWAIAYDLSNPNDISLVFIGDDIMPSEGSEIDVYRFAPPAELRIRGSLNISMTTFDELNNAFHNKPGQRIISCLHRGDYEVYHSPSAGMKLRSHLNWIKAA